MMRTLRSSISIGMFIAMFITGCAATKLTSAWKDRTRRIRGGPVRSWSSG